MSSRTEKLAKALTVRRLVFRLTATAIGVVLSGIFLWVQLTPVIAERQQFNQAREDFIATWCSTHGVDPSDPATEKWRAFVERNDDFLTANGDQLSISVGKTIDGVTLVRNGILWTIEEKEAWDIPMEDYWFNYMFPSYFYFFEVSENFDSPPRC
jgi:hypothetical protein